MAVFKGLGWSSPNFRDLKVPRPRQERDFSYPRPRLGLRDLRPTKNDLETETWSRDYNTGLDTHKLSHCVGIKVAQMHSFVAGD